MAYNAGSNQDWALNTSRVSVAVNNSVNLTNLDWCPTCGVCNNYNLLIDSYFMNRTTEAAAFMLCYCTSDLSDNSLINLINRVARAKSEGPFLTLSTAMNWAITNGVFVTNQNYPQIVTSGNTLNLDAGLPSSYPKTGTVWYDLTNNPNNNGTLVNGVTYNSGSKGYLSFNGINRYISFTTPTNIPIGNSNYTISVWFFINTISSNQGLVGWGNYGTTNQVNAFKLTTTGLSNSWGSNDLNVTTTITNGNWYNAVATFNGTTRSIWVNGVLIGSDLPIGHNVPNANNLTIGLTDTTEYYNGIISEVQIFNRGLTSNEIVSNYNALLTRYNGSDTNICVTPTYCPQLTPTPTQTYTPTPSTTPIVICKSYELSFAGIPEDTFVNYSYTDCDGIPQGASGYVGEIGTPVYFCAELDTVSSSTGVITVLGDCILSPTPTPTITSTPTRTPTQTPTNTATPTPSTTPIPSYQCSLQDVTIGTQTWAACNLNVSTYRDGTPIPEVQGEAEWAALTTGAWCYIDNNPTSGAVYGKLYNWYAMVGIWNAESLTNPVLRKEIAPVGYILPIRADWDILSGFLGGDSVAGGKMKSTNTSVNITPGYWLSPNTDATNSSGWSALPGGLRTEEGYFYFDSSFGKWWTNMGVESGIVEGESLWYLQGSLTREDLYTFNNQGSSIRVLLEPAPINCISLIGTIISPVPQTGVNNYYGVNVALDPWPISENVTVTGYIKDDDNPSNQYDFSIIIYSSEQSGETANNVLVTGGASTATMEITGVTPTTVTYNGNSVYFCGFQPPTPSPTPTNTQTPTVTPTATPYEIITGNGVCDVTVNGGSGGRGYFEYTIQLGIGTGTIQFTYDAYTVPDQFQIYYNGSLVIDTGFRGDSYYNSELNALGYPNVSGPGTGSASFTKTSASPETCLVVITAPIIGTAWTFLVGCPPIVPTPTQTPTNTATPTVTPTPSTTPPPNSVEWSEPPYGYGGDPSGGSYSINGTVEIIGDPVTFRAFVSIPDNAGPGSFTSYIWVGTPTPATNRYVEIERPRDVNNEAYSTSFMLPAGTYDFEVTNTWFGTGGAGEGGIVWTQ